MNYFEAEATVIYSNPGLGMGLVVPRSEAALPRGIAELALWSDAGEPQDRNDDATWRDVLSVFSNLKQQTDPERELCPDLCCEADQPVASGTSEVAREGAKSRATRETSPSASHAWRRAVIPRRRAAGSIACP